MQRKSIEFYLSKISQGVILSLIILAFLFIWNKDNLIAQLCLYETLPSYEIEDTMKMIFNFGGSLGGNMYAAETESAYIEEESKDVFSINKIEDTMIANNSNEIIGVNDVIYQPETDSSVASINNHFMEEILTIDDIEALKDINYLKSKFYVVDKRTDISPSLFNVSTFVEKDLKIDNSSNGPKVLIFHTHSNEKYSDSVDKSEGVIGVGERLKQTLEEKYAIKTIHNTTSFDIVDGKSKILGAYERMEPSIKKILEDNPSIEIVIDLHRDGVPETTRLVTEINGKPTAKIMFFNGLSMLYDNGVLSDIKSLPNKYLETNLAMSFQMQLAINNLYPGMARKVYLNAYRYSLHMIPKSLLIEVGAQTNTKEEAFNAVEPIADTLAHVILN